MCGSHSGSLQFLGLYSEYAVEWPKEMQGLFDGMVSHIACIGPRLVMYLHTACLLSLVGNMLTCTG
jgi:hypothetical protein